MHGAELLNVWQHYRYSRGNAEKLRANEGRLELFITAILFNAANINFAIN
jgi:hypothetical protein